MEQTPFIMSLRVAEMQPTVFNAEICGKMIAGRFRDGGNLLPDVTRLRAVMLACETAIKELQSDVVDEVSKYPKGIAEIQGAKLEKAEVGVKYDYTQTPRWLELKAKEDAIAAERKDLEARLKVLKSPTAFTDMDSGDTYECFPPIKTSTTSYKVTLAKQDTPTTLQSPAQV